MKVAFISCYFLSIFTLISGPVNQYFFLVSHQKYKQIRKLLKFSARESLLEALAYIYIQFCKYQFLPPNQKLFLFSNIREKCSCSFIYSLFIDAALQTQYPQREIPFSSLLPLLATVPSSAGGCQQGSLTGPCTRVPQVLKLSIPQAGLCSCWLSLAEGLSVSRSHTSTGWQRFV